MFVYFKTYPDGWRVHCSDSVASVAVVCNPLMDRRVCRPRNYSDSFHSRPWKCCSIRQQERSLENWKNLPKIQISNL